MTAQRGYSAPMPDGGIIRLLALSVGYTLAALLVAALRFAGAVTLPWLWVLSPLWLPLATTAIACIGLAVMRLTGPTRLAEQSDPSRKRSSDQ